MVRKHMYFADSCDGNFLFTFNQFKLKSPYLNYMFVFDMSSTTVAPVHIQSMTF